MDISEILKLIALKPDCYPQIIKAKYREFYDTIYMGFIGEKFSEKIYRWIHVNDLDIGQCKLCKLPAKFSSMENGFRLYCSKKCSNAATAKVRGEKLKQTEKNPLFWITKCCKLCNKDFRGLISKNPIFCSNECSTRYTANDSNRIDKIKSTKLERYGDVNYVNVEKAKTTNLERYGVENVNHSLEIIEKVKATNREKYGADWTFQSPTVKDKIKDTVHARYGVDNVIDSEKIQNKVKKTNLEKYGSENPFGSNEIKKKIYETNMVRYGKKIPSESDIIKAKIKTTIRDINWNNLVRSSKILEFVTPILNMEDYKGTDKSNVYEFQCKKCNSIFNDHIDGGYIPRCLTCYPFIAGFSIGEKEVIEFVKSVCSDLVIEKDRTVLNGLELDVYIPSKKVAIEFDGLYWHSELNGKDKNYHLYKTVECEKQGIQLIHIFEDEWKNHADIIKCKLKSILGCSENKIYARNCLITEMTFSTTKQFLEENHIQGSANSEIRYGLYNNSELIGVMTFGKLRLALGNKSSTAGAYELVRYCSKINIVGGASKLLAHFIKTHNPNKIITYADRRYSRGNLYEKLGFTKTSEGSPNYWYFRSTEYIRYHRFGFRKDQLNKKLSKFDPNLTEWENMKMNGYNRIWDCGSLKYELKLK